MIGAEVTAEIDLSALAEALPGYAVMGAEAIAEEARSILSVPGSGEPSAPGEPPREQSGRGVAAVAVSDNGDGSADVVVAGAEYLAVLDKGNDRVAARPWVAQAIAGGMQRIKGRGA